MARQHKSKSTTILTCLTAILLTAAIPAGAHVLYVDVDSTAPSPKGKSWSDAFDNLQDALAAAHEDPTVHVIRIADGTYNPHASTRSISFELVNNVALEGGYVGISGVDPDERDWDIYVTILSGELSAADMSDNSYHVVTCAAGVTGSLKGLTIERGNANGGTADSFGGGIRNGYGSSPFTEGGTLTLDYCIFDDNHADLAGGGMSNVGNPATLRNCTFTDNDATDAGNGGAFYNHRGDGDDTTTAFTDCTFETNDAGNGGAVWSNGEITLSFTGCTFDQNSSDSSGGAIFLGSVSAITVDGCDFTSNTALAGGAMHVRGVASRPSSVDDTTFTSNSVTGTGGAGEGGAIWSTGFLEVGTSTFTTNTATTRGGAIHVGHETGAVTEFAACIFDANTADESGGAVFEDDAGMVVTYVNSLFDSNTSSGAASSSFGGGAIYSAGNTGADYVNCTFVNNQAIDGQGGGIRVKAGRDPNVINCIFWDNGDETDGDTQDEEAQIYRDTDAEPTVTHCTIEGCDTAVGGFCFDSDDGNKAVEPDFVGTGAHPYQLKDIAANVLLIDDGDGEDVAGDCKSVNLTDKDLAGGNRFKRKDAFCDTTEAKFVDIGAYEVQIP